MLNQFINLQLFAEDCGTAAAEQTGVTASDAGERQDFETMIRGPYKDEFDARVQKILDGRLRSLRRENEALRREAQHRQTQARDSFAALQRSEAQVRAVYPEFDWQREVENGDFARLIAAGVAPRTAYEVVHRDEILRRAMACAAQRTAQHTAAAAAAGARRVQETGRRSAALSRQDPRQLTSDELADIRRRVLDGEKIRF